MPIFKLQGTRFSFFNSNFRHNLREGTGRWPCEVRTNRHLFIQHPRDGVLPEMIWPPRSTTAATRGRSRRAKIVKILWSSSLTEPWCITFSNSATSTNRSAWQSTFYIFCCHKGYPITVPLFDFFENPSAPSDQLS